MGVTTTWETHHARGHAAPHDLSARRPSERAGHPPWLAGKDYADTWRAGREADAGGQSAAWPAGRHAEELTETETLQTRAAMPPLDGIDRRDAAPSDRNEPVTDAGSNNPACTSETPS